MKRAGVLIFIFAAMFFLEACKEKSPVPKAPQAKAAQPSTPQEGVEVKAPKVEEEVHIYDKTGRRDPFISLVIKAQELPKKGQTPLESYDVSAIKVIGIVLSDKGYYAEVVLPDGKAYTVRENMTIGLHDGKIQKITKDSLSVKENIKDYKGEIKSKQTNLKLREGEEE